MLKITTLARSFIIAAFFSIVALIPSARAQTLDIYVNSSTWAYDRHSVSGSGEANIVNYAVTGTVPPYNTSETRYYFAGFFDVVVIRNKDTDAAITTLSSCYSICYIKGTSVYKLTNGYNGSGNGVDGIIDVAAYASNGDLYIGGDFDLAGGYSHASNFSCYRFNEGWSGVNEVELNGPVTGFTWSSYKLIVTGSFNTAHGPTTSGGSVYSSLTSLPGSVAWNDYYKTFPNGWWTTN